MLCEPAEGDLINEYGLVCYIPGPLGEFLDRLRQELVQGCTAQSHVSVLPPREVFEVEEAKGQICEQAERTAPFFVKLGEVKTFPETHVIYIEIAAGAEYLKNLYTSLNKEALQFTEKYEYHPHITLAQRYEPSLEPKLLEISKRRWAEFQGSRTFAVDHVLFVQNSKNDLWLDLLCCELSGDRQPVGVQRR